MWHRKKLAFILNAVSKNDLKETISLLIARSPFNDIAYKSPLDTIRLHHDESSLLKSTNVSSCFERKQKPSETTGRCARVRTWV
jgi:hypothetical protein